MQGFQNGADPRLWGMDVDHYIEVACIDRCKHGLDAAHIPVDENSDRFSAADLGEGACDPLSVLHQFRKGNIPMLVGNPDFVRMIFCSLFEIF